MSKAPVSENIKNKVKNIRDFHWECSGKLELEPSLKNEDIYAQMLKQMYQRFTNLEGENYSNLLPAKTLEVCMTGDWQFLDSPND